MITPDTVDLVLGYGVPFLLLLSVVCVWGAALRGMRYGFSCAVPISIAAVFIAASAWAMAARQTWLPVLDGTGQDDPGTPSLRDRFDQVGVWLSWVWPWALKGVLLALAASGMVVVMRLVAGWVIAAVAGTKLLRAERRVRTITASRRLESSLSRWESLRDSYGTLLMDPVRSLELQALFDLQVDQSRAFHLAWVAFDDLARQMRNDDASSVSEDSMDRLESRAADAENLWTAALRHAERIGWTNLASADQPRAARVLGLLTTANDPAATAGERDNAWTLADRILAELNLAHLPEQAVASINARTRQAIPRSQRHDEPKLHQP